MYIYMYIYIYIYGCMRDVHGNWQCGIPILHVGFPREWEPTSLN